MTLDQFVIPVLVCLSVGVVTGISGYCIGKEAGRLDVWRMVCALLEANTPGMFAGKTESMVERPGIVRVYQDITPRIIRTTIRK